MYEVINVYDNSYTIYHITFLRINSIADALRCCPLNWELNSFVILKSEVRLSVNAFRETKV